jgi:hypothetical protein
MLRRIFRHWKKLQGVREKECHNFYTSCDVVSVIQYRRMGLARHVAQKGDGKRTQHFSQEV